MYIPVVSSYRCAVVLLNCCWMGLEGVNVRKCTVMLSIQALPQGEMPECRKTILMLK